MLQRVVEAHGFFCLGDSYSTQVLFSKAALSASHFLARVECWAPRVFVWVLFCMPSVYACLIPISLFFSYLSAHFLPRTLVRLYKTYSLLTKRVFFFSPFTKRKEGLAKPCKAM